MKSNGEYVNSHDPAFSSEVRRELETQRQATIMLAESVQSLSRNIAKQNEINIRREESDLRQQEINAEVREHMKDMQAFKQEILIARAQDSYIIAFLKSKFPYIVIALLAVGYETASYFAT